MSKSLLIGYDIGDSTTTVADGEIPDLPMEATLRVYGCLWTLGGLFDVGVAMSLTIPQSSPSNSIKGGINSQKSVVYSMNGWSKLSKMGGLWWYKLSKMGGLFHEWVA